VRQSGEENISLFFMDLFGRGGFQSLDISNGAGFVASRRHRKLSIYNSSHFFSPLDLPIQNSL